MVTITVQERPSTYNLSFLLFLLKQMKKHVLRKRKQSLHSNRIITTLHSQVSSSNQTATNILHLHRPDQALHSAPSTYMLHPSKAISVSHHYKRTKTCTVENHSPFPTLCPSQPLVDVLLYCSSRTLKIQKGKVLIGILMLIQCIVI